MRDINPTGSVSDIRGNAVSLSQKSLYHVHLSELFTELFTLPVKYFLFLFFVIYACESLFYKFQTTGVSRN